MPEKYSPEQREILEKIAGPEFMERLKMAVKNMAPFTKEQLEAAAQAEEACTCKHCGRCVLAGPPCCYQKVYDMYQETYSEVLWLRKVQSKKDKEIAKLKAQIEFIKENR